MNCGQHVAVDVRGHEGDSVWISPSRTENYVNGVAVLDYFKTTKKVHKPLFLPARCDEPQARAPRAFEPRAFEPRAFEPRAFEPRAFEPRAFAVKNYDVFEKNMGSRMSEILGADARPVFDADAYKAAGGSFDSNSIAEIFRTATLPRMRRGDPLIISAPLASARQQVFGIVDFLVRSDVLNRISPGSLDEDEIVLPEDTLLGQRFWYVAVDAKCRRLELSSDGRHLMNEDGIAGYKSQVFWYQECLREISGNDTPRVAFLVGTGFTMTQRGNVLRSDDPLGRLGRVSFDGYDTWIPSVALDARMFLRDLRKNTGIFDLLFSNLHENGVIGSHANLLIVNAKKLDYFYAHRPLAKKYVGANVTAFMYCGKKELAAALKEGFFKVTDAGFTKEWLKRNLSPFRFRDAENVFDAMSLPLGTTLPAFLTPEIVVSSSLAATTSWIDHITYRDIFVDIKRVSVADAIVLRRVANPHMFLISVLDPEVSIEPAEFDANENVCAVFSNIVTKVLHQEDLSKCPRQVRLWHYGKYEVAKWMEIRELFRKRNDEIDVIGSHRAPWFDAYAIARSISFSVSGAMNRKLEDMGAALPMHHDEAHMQAGSKGNVLLLRRVLTHMRSIPRL